MRSLEYICDDDGEAKLVVSESDAASTRCGWSPASADEPIDDLVPTLDLQIDPITGAVLNKPLANGSVEQTIVAYRTANPPRLAATEIKPETRRTPRERFREALEVQTRPPVVRRPRGADPEKIGQYRIVRRIGTGGMGIVYEAAHERLGRRAAIKVLRKSVLNEPELVQRFMGEAIAAARVRHSGVVTVYDFGHLEDGTAYLVMEYLEGQSLADRLNRGEAMTLEEAVEIARQVATTLAHAHAAGVVHRDLKPDNVFLVRDSATDAIRTKVLDFGVAKFAREQIDWSMQTRMGKILGTPWYMPPEQCKAAFAVDHRSDIYSLGCVLFQLTCGRVPFPGKLHDVLAAHLNSSPPLPRTLNPQIPRSLQTLILQMMSKSPDERPQSMADVERALRTLDLMAEESLAGDTVLPERQNSTLARTRLRADSAPPIELPDPPRSSGSWALALVAGLIVVAVVAALVATVYVV